MLCWPDGLSQILFLCQPFGNVKTALSSRSLQKQTPQQAWPVGHSLIIPADLDMVGGRGSLAGKSPGHRGQAAMGFCGGQAGLPCALCWSPPDGITGSTA